MTSYFLSYNCVVILVLIGDALCAGGRSNTPSSSEHWMSGLEMANVAITNPLLNNAKSEGGVVRSSLRKISGVDRWCWEYHESGRRNDGNRGRQADGRYYNLFPISEVYVTGRNGKRVNFLHKPDDTTSNAYILDFASETDARNFTGEGPGVKSKKYKFFSSCRK